MKKSIVVKITPSVLKWARESVGLSAEELSKKIQLAPQKIYDWEEGKTYPTLTQLQKISNYVKRNLAVFFLPSPPEEPPLPNDFRTLPDTEKKLSRETLLAIRKSRRLQKVARELMQYLGEPTEAKIEKVSLQDNPEEIARREREKIGIDIDTQLKWKSPHEAFREWKSALETLNVFTFQFKIPVKEVRGFSLTDEEPKLIIVSSSDIITARIFTLFHEYAHILLDEPGICNLFGELSPQSNEVENWAHAFAGEFLLPQEILETEQNFRNAIYDSNLLLTLHRKYKVSRHCILVRLLFARLITLEQYKRAIVYERSFEPKPEPFAQSPYKKCLNEKGKWFVSLVIKSAQHEFITYDSALDYLSIKLKHLQKLESYAL